MSFLNGFLKMFGFVSEADDENETEPDDQEIADDEEEGEEEDSGFSFRIPRSPFSRKNQQAAPGRASARREEPQDDAQEEQPRATRNGNVIHDPRMGGNASESQYVHCERIVSVRQINECRAIIQCLLRGESVLLNLENIDPKNCGRVVDMLSGAAFALQGHMLKVAHLSYLLAPNHVEVVQGGIYPSDQAQYR